MKKYFRPTGNPFVDSGIYALAEWSGKRNLDQLTPSDIEALLPSLLKVYYSPEWRKMLVSWVFSNHKIFYDRPGSKNQGSYQRTMLELIKQMKPLGEEGNCIACGQRSARKDSELYRNWIPLTGSGEFRNFYAAANRGADYCETCLVAIQFMPLMVSYCGPLAALFHSGNKQFMSTWAKESIKLIRQQIASGNYLGAYKWHSTKPRSALAEAASKIISEYAQELFEESTTVRMYHFTNYGQTPTLDMHDLPSDVFIFLLLVRREGLWSTWEQKVVLSGYSRNKDGELAFWSNQVFERLSDGRSILPYFINLRLREAKVPWRMVEIYTREVRDLKPEKLEVIKSVADKIARLIQQTGKHKRLFELENTKNYNQMLRHLLRLSKDNLQANNSYSLVGLEELTDSLFPNGPLNWRETKYLLLIRIYEQLHEYLANSVELPENDLDEEGED